MPKTPGAKTVTKTPDHRYQAASGSGTAQYLVATGGIQLGRNKAYETVEYPDEAIYEEVPNA